MFKTNQGVFNYRVAAVWIEQEHILIHRQAHDNHWALPGGRVKLLEDSKTTIEREIREELDEEVQANQLLRMTENFFEYENNKFHEMGLYYLVKPIDNTKLINQEEFYGLEGKSLIYKWVPIAELDQIELYPEFLRTKLKQLPTATEHLIVEQ
ncbi:NUDIX hydrolase [Bacillaceae bacterium W0354]